MSTLDFSLELDTTGVLPANKIVGESHTTLASKIKVIAPHKGGYHKSSLKIKDVQNNRYLTPDSEFICYDKYQVPSNKYGIDIYSLIVINKDDTGVIFEIEYQALGGAWQTSQMGLIKIFNKLNKEDRPVDWGSIFAPLPNYPNAPYLIDINGRYGSEYVIAEIERIYNTMLLGDQLGHQQIMDYIDSILQRIFDAFDDELEEHKQSGDHDHRYFTKQQADARFKRKGNIVIDSTLEGPLSIYQGQNYSWHITNFDAFSTYRIEVNQGEVNLNKDTVTYIMPAGLSVNGDLIISLYRNNQLRTYTVKLIESGIVSPAISLSSNNNVCNLLTPTITLSPFTVIPAGFDTIKSTDIQLATDPNFETMVWQRMGDVSSNQLRAVLPKLAPKQRYYLRARFNGNKLTPSKWSLIVINTNDQQVVRNTVSHNTTYAYQYNVTSYVNTRVNSYSERKSVRVTIEDRTRITYRYSYFIYTYANTLPKPVVTSDMERTWFLNDDTNRRLYGDWASNGGDDVAGKRMRKWKGYHVLGGDGTGYNVATGDTVRKFDYNKVPAVIRMYGWWELRYETRINYKVTTRTTVTITSSALVNKTIQVINTIGRNTSVTTSFNTSYPLGNYVIAPQQNISLKNGLNTMATVFTGQIKFTSRSTSRLTSWITDSARNTTRATSRYSYSLQNIANIASYTCYNGNFDPN